MITKNVKTGAYTYKNESLYFLWHGRMWEADAGGKRL